MTHIPLARTHTHTQCTALGHFGTAFDMIPTQEGPLVIEHSFKKVSVLNTMLNNVFFYCFDEVALTFSRLSLVGSRRETSPLRIFEYQASHPKCKANL